MSMRYREHGEQDIVREVEQPEEDEVEPEEGGAASRTSEHLTIIMIVAV
jgi:hypothetical protein